MPKNFFFDVTEITPPKKQRRPAPTGCSACGLDRECTSPKMKPYGEGRAGILIVGEAPGENEDLKGRPFVGRSGELLRKCLRAVGIDLDRDCLITNVVQCRPTDEDGKNREPDAYEIQCCSARLEEQINNFRPDVILALGTPAIQAVLREGQHLGLSATSMYGRTVPSVERKCPVVCGFHPSYYLHADGKYDRFMEATCRQVRDALVSPPEPKLLDPARYSVLETVEEVRNVLAQLERDNRPTAIDYETTGLNPLKENFRPLMIGLANTPDFGYIIPLEHPHARWTSAEMAEVYEMVRKFLQSSVPKVIQNWQFEERVSVTYSRIKTGVVNVICDTMVREHVLDNRKGVCGQDFQEFVRYGETAHKQIRKDDLAHEFMDTVARYCALDVRYCIQWFNDQEKEMDDDLRRAYDLFHRATPVFARLSMRGVRVDMDVLDRMEEEAVAELDALRPDSGIECLKTYRAKYGVRWEPTSGKAKQLLFYGILGLKPLKTTNSGTDLANPEHCSTDAESMTYLLEQLSEGTEERLLVQAVKDRSHLDKLLGYIRGIRELVDDGCIHPAFLLHTVSSYRSSSADPNFQNFPVRVERMAALRRAFVPKNDFLMEIDFSGAEVRGYAINTKDATLISHIVNNVDYHKHYAALLYEIPEEEVTKEQRHKGKNGFVFPEFYGDVAASIARSNPQWRRNRVEEVERIFWNDLPDVKAWQNRMWDFYRENLYLPYLTGFKARLSKEGLLSYNAVANYPNQGLAFQRLVECLLKLEEAMRAEGLKSEIIGQIHDSICIDGVESERERILELAQPIIADAVWGWDGIVPWEAEYKFGPNMLDWKKVA